MVINKNTTNSIPFTAYEKGVLTNPYYLFEFRKDDTNNFQYWVGTDISTYKVRYNECSFVEPTDLNLVTGDYYIKIYEQMSSSNIVPTGLTLVDEFKLKVVDPAATSEGEYSGATLTDTVYNG